MFTTNIGWTLLQGVVWFLVFMFVLQFHPWHALGLGVIAMVLVSGLATMGVESVLAKRRDVSNATRAFVPTEPVRQSLGPGPGPAAAPPKETEKAK
jgi:hypothetical protein